MDAGKLRTPSTAKTSTERRSTDEVYQYYVWLDQPGGNIDSSTTPKRLKDQENYVSYSETMHAFSFDYGSRNINTLQVEISQQGTMCYSFDAVTVTPAIFKPGVYDIRLYQNGDLCVELTGVSISGGTEISF